MRITREIGIDMGHRVTYHGSKCRNLHGHRYRIEVTLQGRLKTDGEEEGMVMDFGFLKNLMMEEIDRPCDHGTCLWIADPELCRALGPSLRAISAMVQENGQAETMWQWGKLYVVPFVPTVENLAAHWFKRLHVGVLEHIGNNGGSLYSVKVWETPNCSAVYRATPADVQWAHDYVYGADDDKC